MNLSKRLGGSDVASQRPEKEVVFEEVEAQLSKTEPANSPLMGSSNGSKTNFEQPTKQRDDQVSNSKSEARFTIPMLHVKRTFETDIHFLSDFDLSCDGWFLAFSLK